MQEALCYASQWRPARVAVAWISVSRTWIRRDTALCSLMHNASASSTSNHLVAFVTVGWDLGCRLGLGRSQLADDGSCATRQRPSWSHEHGVPVEHRLDHARLVLEVAHFEPYPRCHLPHHTDSLTPRAATRTLLQSTPSR
jgi:hypothetical protein